MWTEVGEVQRKLRAKLGKDVESKESESSLQLTLEHPKVKEAAEKYCRKLSKALDGKKDVIGYAFAINGKVNSIELFASAELFKKVWPKLLNANAVEAFIEREEGKKYHAVKGEEIKSLLLDPEITKPLPTAANKYVRSQIREMEKSVICESVDRERDVWIHRSYLTK